jgi:AAA15 family ATPase/GTPase
MYFKELYIDNFKGYRKFKIKVDENINILTGLNNSGKTTILEAISLWSEIFNYLLTKTSRSYELLDLSSGEYRFGQKSNNYFDYRKINSVRSFGYDDIFFNLDSTKVIKISALIQLSPHDDIKIAFILIKATGNNYNVYLENHDSFDFRKFNDKFPKLPDSLGCFFSSPVATISNNEEFSLRPKIKEGIKTRESVNYFRNRLYNLYTGDNFDEFKRKLSLILYNVENCIQFNFSGDRSVDINILITININNKGFRDISLLGSGTIQIIEILLHVFESKTDLNLILLDEPDSHIHRDIQKRLLNQLKESDVQVFLTTHNESLIRSADPKNIFFIDETVSDDNETIFIPIGEIPLAPRRTGISSSHHSSVINKIGSETSLDILNALEADKILFVEGTDDAEYIQKIMENTYCDKKCVFWSFGGIDKLISKVKHYREFFEGIGSSEPIWDKCAVIVDADFMTDSQKNTLKNELNSKLSIPIFIWKSYTIESSIFTNKNILIDSIKKISDIKNNSKTQQQVDTSVTYHFNQMKNEKILLLDDLTYSTRISGQLASRGINLASNLSINNIYNVASNMVVINYTLFAKEQLNMNRIDHITNKDDVEKILEGIYNDLSLTKESEFLNYFSEILNINDTSIIYQEWNNLKTFIES